MCLFGGVSWGEECCIGVLYVLVLVLFLVGRSVVFSRLWGVGLSYFHTSVLYHQKR